VADLSAALHAVIAAPTEDEPRLAYADAVAASDPERAELIRIQVALARARQAHVMPAAGAVSQEHALLRARAATWGADLAPLVDKLQFLRGFPEVVTLDAAAFLERADELYRRAPILHLDLTGVTAVAARLFASPQLARIRSLRLNGNRLGDAEVALLAASPHLGNLAWLDLGSNQIGAAGLEALAASQALPKLGYVGFAFNAVEDPTPRHADEYDATSAEGKRLQAAYGPRAWLDAKRRYTWPPPRDAVEYP